MAKGWESKAVEDQISAAEDREDARAKREKRASDMEHRKQIEGLLQERARITREMKESHKRGYLLLLERALAHVEAELVRLEYKDPSL
ncbi:MAG: hypothetical protein WBV94_10105 [Blastocatellia bacterium]